MAFSRLTRASGAIVLELFRKSLVNSLQGMPMKFMQPIHS